MPIFICENCGCIDNTALGGTYWTRNADIYPAEYRGKILCQLCAPKKFDDGTPNKEAGTWHDIFPREKFVDLEAKGEIMRQDVLNPPSDKEIT